MGCEVDPLAESKPSRDKGREAAKSVQNRNARANRCTICSQLTADQKEFGIGMLEAWASGEAPHMSWRAFKEIMQAQGAPIRHRDTYKKHYEHACPELMRALERYLHGEEPEVSG